MTWLDKAKEFLEKNGEFITESELISFFVNTGSASIQYNKQKIQMLLNLGYLEKIPFRPGIYRNKLSNSWLYRCPICGAEFSLMRFSSCPGCNSPVKKEGEKVMHDADTD